jgi:hypothetical protein
VAPGRPRGSRSRRVSLPGVAELLRPVGRGPAVDAERQASGRERHTQKITVYLSGSELLDLERGRIALRALGITVDRGRIVREALAVLLADLDAAGDRSMVARRLREGTRGGGAPGIRLLEGAPSGEVSGGRRPERPLNGEVWGGRPPEGALPE